MPSSPTTAEPAEALAPCCAPLAGPGISAEEAGATAGLFKALADPTRIRIVNLLANSAQPVCVCEMNAHFALTQPTLSHHLKKLVDAGLLTREQRGTWAYYAVDDDSLGQLADIVRRKEVNGVTDVGEEVRDRYGKAARAVGREKQGAPDPDAGCCGASAGSCCDEGGAGFGNELYSLSEREALPQEAVLASLGCGNPAAVADLREGETVLDLGSGGGIDVLLSATRVGLTGKAYGLDMTNEMLSLALENKRKAGVDNVEFLKGYIEAVPLPTGTVDVIISNCVINLSTDKQAVFEEMHRVLRPGGRIGITDVVASSNLTPQQRAQRGSYFGCIAGALSFDEYERGLQQAGFADVEITSTHEVAEGIFSAVIKAARSG